MRIFIIITLCFLLMKCNISNTPKDTIYEVNKVSCDDSNLPYLVDSIYGGSDSLYVVIDSLVYLQNYLAAYNLLQIYLCYEPEDAYAIFNECVLKQRLNMHKEALLCYRKILDTDWPRDKNLNIALIFLELEEKDSAYHFFTKTIEHDSMKSLLFHHRANIAYFHYRDKISGCKDYARMLELGDSSAIETYRVFCTRIIERLDTLNLYKSQLKDHNPENLDTLYFHIGVMYRKLDRADSALYYFNKAIDLNDQDSRYFSERGYLYRLYLDDKINYCKDEKRMLELGDSTNYLAYRIVCKRSRY